MKCPKCGYLGFESSERCRHCGYDFGMRGGAGSAAPPATADDLTLRERGERADEGPLRDLPLRDHPVPPLPELGTGAHSLAEVSPTADLPLFWAPAGKATDTDDTPLITRPSPPRPPLVVRRPSPEVPRGRREGTRTPELDWPNSPGVTLGGSGAPGPPAPPATARVSPEARAPVAMPRVTADAQGTSDVTRGPLVFEAAAMSARLAAVAIDLLLMVGIDALVIYLTVRIGGVSLADWRTLPIGPLTAFFVVQNGGYLVAFTVGGQTLGKMAAGIRVVTVPEDGPVDLGRAFRRTFGWALLAAPCGLGFLTALFADDRRGLHDRWAGTRVVRALPTNAVTVR